MLSVKLFGSGQAQLGEHPLNGFPNQYACLLLCYLLLNKPHPQNREKLAHQFWGDLPSQTSRKYLRNALWRLRQSFQSAGEPFEKYIFISEDTISFINVSDTWLDTEIFENVISQYLIIPDHEINAQQVQNLENAAYLGKLSLLIGYPNGAHGSSKNSVLAVDPNSPIWNTPYNTNLPHDHILKVYDENSSYVVIYFPTPLMGTQLMGQDPDDSRYYTILMQVDRFALWGFDKGPQAMTNQGQRLFVNILDLLIP